MRTPTRTLGLVGGLGLEAGIFYYERLAKTCENAGALLRMLLVHGDAQTSVGHMFAGEHAQLAAYLSGLIGQLAAGGADIAAIPAVTPHVCIADVVSASPIPIVNMLEVLSAELQRSKLRRIALFGTRFVIESDLYGSLPSSIEPVHPSRSEIERIDEMYRNYAVHGHGGASERAEFTAIANGLIAREGVESIVLAGTDLSSLFAAEKPAFPYVDASELHINAILERILPTLSS